MRCWLARNWIWEDFYFVAKPTHTLATGRIVWEMRIFLYKADGTSEEYERPLVDIQNQFHTLKELVADQWRWKRKGKPSPFPGD